METCPSPMVIRILHATPWKTRYCQSYNYIFSDVVTTLLIAAGDAAKIASNAYRAYRSGPSQVLLEQMFPGLGCPTCCDAFCGCRSCGSLRCASHRDVSITIDTLCHFCDELFLALLVHSASMLKGSALNQNFLQCPGFLCWCLCRTGFIQANIMKHILLPKGTHYLIIPL